MMEQESIMNNLEKKCLIFVDFQLCNILMKNLQRWREFLLISLNFQLDNILRANAQHRKEFLFISTRSWRIQDPREFSVNIKRIS